MPRMIVESSMLPFRMMISSGLLRTEISPELTGRRNAGMTRPNTDPAKRIGSRVEARILMI